MTDQKMTSAQRLAKSVKGIQAAALLTRRARELTEAYETYMPVIERTNIELAEIQAGQEHVSQMIADAKAALDVLIEKFREAATEQGAATFSLKEYEGTPAELVDMSSDLGTLLTNVGQVPGLLSAALQQATEAAFDTACRDVETATLQARMAAIDRVLVERLNEEAE